MPSKGSMLVRNLRPRQNVLPRQDRHRGAGSALAEGGSGRIKRRHVLGGSDVAAHPLAMAARDTRPVSDGEASPRAKKCASLSGGG